MHCAVKHHPIDFSPLWKRLVGHTWLVLKDANEIRSQHNYRLHQVNINSSLRRCFIFPCHDEAQTQASLDHWNWKWILIAVDKVDWKELHCILRSLSSSSCWEGEIEGGGDCGGRVSWFCNWKSCDTLTATGSRTRKYPHWFHHSWSQPILLAFLWLVFPSAAIMALHL